MVATIALSLWSCQKDKPSQANTPQLPQDDGVFIANEGNFNYGNASLSFYNPATKTVSNKVFYKANQAPVGDVLQSLSLHNDQLFMVVNNSGKVYVINAKSQKHTGTITGLLSPRYVHFLDDDKMYISDLYARAISIADSKRLAVHSQINLDNGHAKQHPSEQMLSYGKYVFCNAWSYDNKVLVIDSESDQLIDTIEVAKQPNSMVMDKNNKLWVLCDGGYEGSPYGQEQGALIRIDAATRQIELSLPFPLQDNPSRLCTNGSRDSLYFINKHIYRLAITDKSLPNQALIKSNYTAMYGGFYGLGVHPISSEIYVADAIDFQQNGNILRYNAQGQLIDEFKVGIIPNAFCFTATKK